jgi:hypothetical protein
MSVFGTLQSLRDRPVGDQGPARAARKGFRQRIAIARDNRLFGEAVVEARDAWRAKISMRAIAIRPIGTRLMARPTGCGCAGAWPRSWRG